MKYIKHYEKFEKYPFKIGDYVILIKTIVGGKTDLAKYGFKLKLSDFKQIKHFLLICLSVANLIK